MRARNFFAIIAAMLVALIAQGATAQAPGVVVGPIAETPIPGIFYVPDGHISTVPTAAGIEVYVAAIHSTYRFEVRSLADLTDAPTQLVLGPGASGSDLDLHYAGLGGVLSLPGRDPSYRLGFYHAERRQDAASADRFQATVMLTESSDAGLTWRSHAEVIRGSRLREPEDGISGAGQPCAILVADSSGREWVYVYYTEWWTLEPDSIYLARAPMESAHDPSTYRKWDGNGWVTALGGLGAPVIRPPALPGYAALASVSWNTNLQRLLVVFEAKDGFYLATGQDGITWSQPVRFHAWEAAPAVRGLGEQWYSYPTLIDSVSGSSSVTTGVNRLYFSSGQWGFPHNLATRDLTLDAGADLQRRVVLPVLHRD